MSQVKEAVLELKSAMHNWRRDPSPENTRNVMLASETVCGHTLDLAAFQELTLERETDTHPPGDRCKCGGLTVPCHIAGATVPITKCTTCDALFALVNLSGGPHA